MFRLALNATQVTRKEISEAREFLPLWKRQSEPETVPRERQRLSQVWSLVCQLKMTNIEQIFYTPLKNITLKIIKASLFGYFLPQLLSQVKQRRNEIFLMEKSVSSTFKVLFKTKRKTILLFWYAGLLFLKKFGKKNEEILKKSEGFRKSIVLSHLV